MSNDRSLILAEKGMPEAVKTEHPHIVRLPGVCGGEPVIDGLRVAVRHVATLHQRGESIPEIADALGLTEAQVFHALSYFFDHQDEIQALIDEEDARFAQSFASPGLLLNFTMGIDVQESQNDHFFTRRSGPPSRR